LQDSGPLEERERLKKLMHLDKDIEPEKYSGGVVEPE
jgi:hypothetical protein